MVFQLRLAAEKKLSANVEVVSAFRKAQVKADSVEDVVLPELNLFSRCHV